MTIRQIDEDKSTSLDENAYEHGAPSPSKRSLLKAAWIAPVVVAVALPRSGYAANISAAHHGSRRSDDGDAKGNKGKHFGWFKKGS